MISVDEALAEILSHVEPLEAERVAILDALGRVLVEEIVSDIEIPPFDNSAMDGYAVRAADVAGATPEAPVALTVVGNVAAGYVTGAEVEPGTTIRIMTGAPMPAGADAVVPFEDTSDFDRSKEERLASPATEIEVRQPVQPQDHVRPAGEDVRLGEQVMAPGRLIRPQEIGVLASLGHATVLVHRRPKVAILATGDELLEVHEPLAPGKIRNSNEYTNAALVERTGGIPIRLGIARDTVVELTAKIRSGLEQGADLFLTSGGVSVGDYDVVKDVLGTEGEMQFWQVRMKPGKPLAFGLLAGRGAPHRPAGQSGVGHGLLRAVCAAGNPQDAGPYRPGQADGAGGTGRAADQQRAAGLRARDRGPARGRVSRPDDGRAGLGGADLHGQGQRPGDYPRRDQPAGGGQPRRGADAGLARGNGRMSGGRDVPVVSLVGKSGVGKTTALERVIREIKRRGYRVGTVKHDTHGFDMDKPGKDSWRHAQAGSDSVVDLWPAQDGPHPPTGGGDAAG